MGLPFELRIALRYLTAKRKAGVSLTGALTVAGVALGVWALTVVTSVWNGFETEFLDKLLGINAHAIVLKSHDVFRDHRSVADRLRQDPAVLTVAPFVYSEVIVQSARGVQGVALKGIDPDLAVDLPLSRYVGEEAPQVFGELSSRAAGDAPARTPPGMIIGTELQQTLHVVPGDTVTVISPYGGRDGEARTAAFEVVGVFHSGMFEFDSRMVFIALSESQSFFRLFETVTGLEVWSNDPLASYDTLGEALRRISPDDPWAFELKDWSRTNAGIFGAVRSQKSLISVVLFFIVMVAALNIMATLMLLVLEKRREIAVLESLGATRRSILGVFVIDGILVGVLGCGVGAALGLFTCSVLQEYGLRLDPRVYYLERLPIVVEPTELAAVIGGALVLAFFATLFPALTAARGHPVDGLTGRSLR